MAARLQITVESACNLYNSDGVLAGKSDPYIIIEVLGQESMKLQTEVISNELNPAWNFTGEIAGFMDGDVLRFTVMDKDKFPKPDNFLGQAELTAEDFYPDGFHGELALVDSKTQATLTVKVVVTGCDEADPELVEGVEGSSSAAPLPSGFIIQGLQVYNPGVITTTITTSHSMTYSAPQTDSVPQVPTDDMVTEAPQAPVPDESVTATDNIVVYPPVTVTAEEFAKLSGTILTEPLPVTEGTEAVGIEALGVGKKREVDLNNTEAVDKTVKIKTKKSMRCC